jgi:hypothetical protein
MFAAEISVAVWGPDKEYRQIVLFVRFGVFRARV